MCDALEVSRSSYYSWSKRPTCSRTQENQQLSEQIKQIHQKSRNSYGAPRIHAALKHKGFEVGRHRLARLMARLMARLGISVRPRRRFKSTTDSNHPFPIAENVLNRHFTAQEPDQAWVADITYIPTAQGWLYLAVVIDLFSRRVVGWSMAEHMRLELVLNALEAALGHRVPAVSGLLFHSDRGSQYASGEY
jgi:putative transposase